MNGQKSAEIRASQKKKEYTKSKTYKPKYGMLWLRIKFQNETRCSLLFNGMGCLCVRYKGRM